MKLIKPINIIGLIISDGAKKAKKVKRANTVSATDILKQSISKVKKSSIVLDTESEASTTSTINFLKISFFKVI